MKKYVLFKCLLNLSMFLYLLVQLDLAFTKIKALENEEESKKRIRLIKIRNQISALEENPVDFNMEMTAGEKVYRNDLVRFISYK